MARWQFQDFCKENPRNNEEFRRTVEKMITTEEKQEKDSRIETIETTRTGKILETIDIRRESEVQTTQ